MNIHKQILIPASPEYVWELLTDIDKIKRWVPCFISDEPVSEGEVGVGYISTLKLKEGSRIVAYESEISAFSPPKRLSIILRGGSLGKEPLHIDYQLSQSHLGTQVIYKNCWRAHGLMLKLIAPLINLMARKNAQQALNALKALANEE